MTGGGDLSADRQPAAKSRRDCRAWAPNMLMRNASFIRFMVGLAE